MKWTASFFVVWVCCFTAGQEVFAKPKRKQISCDWAATSHPKQFASVMTLSVQSALDITSEPETSKGEILIQDQSTFLWRVSKEKAIYVYHGTPDQKLTYTQFNKKTGKVSQVGESQVLDSAWVNHFAALVLVGKTESYDATHVLTQSKLCQSRWHVSKTHQGPIPPFAEIEMMWQPKSTPKILELRFKEHLGNEYTLKLSKMKWRLPAKVNRKLGQFSWIQKHLVPKYNIYK